MFALLGLVVTLSSLTIPREARVPDGVSKGRASTIRVFQSFLARRDTSAALVIAFLVSGGLVGFLTYIGQWLHIHFGISTGGIGWVFMLGGLVAVAGSPLGGILSDRLGKRTVAIASNVVLALAIAVVPFFPWGVWLLILFCVASLSTAFRQGPLTALITELVSQHQRGFFVALHNISSQLGIALAVLVGGLLYERHGYVAVTTVCAAMTALVAILLATHIVEPQGDVTLMAFLVSDTDAMKPLPNTSPPSFAREDTENDEPRSDDPGSPWGGVLSDRHPGVLHTHYHEGPVQLP